MERCIQRGIGERTQSKNIRLDQIPQVNIIFKYSGDPLDTIVDRNGVILKFKCHFGVNPTWTFARLPPILPAVRGYLAKGIGIGSLSAITGRPQFANLPPTNNPSFYLQGLLSYWKKSSVCSGMMWGSGNTSTGSFDANFVARSPETTFLGGSVAGQNAGTRVALQNFGQMRGSGVGIINLNAIGNGIVRSNNSFNKVSNTAFNFNLVPLDLVLGSQEGLFIRAEQAELYGRVDYSCTDTNKLNKTQFIMRQKQLSKLILNTFGNPLLK